MLFVDWSGCVIAVKWENARNRLGPGSSTDSTSKHSWEKNMQNNVGKKGSYLGTVLRVLMETVGVMLYTS
jgi:hypothetical protein